MRWGILLAALCAAGCATITRGTTSKVTITSEPPGAAIRTTAGFSCERTPCVIEVPRKTEFAVTASLPGYREQTIEVVSKLSGEGAAAFTLGAVLTIGGAVADIASGAPLDHHPNPVHFVLEKLPQPAPAPAGRKRV